LSQHLVQVLAFFGKGKEAKDGWEPVFLVKMLTPGDFLFGWQQRWIERRHRVCSFGISLSKTYKPTIEKEVLECGPAIEPGFLNPSLEHRPSSFLPFVFVRCKVYKSFCALSIFFSVIPNFKLASFITMLLAGQLFHL
jgi:hypothetical protein